MTEPQTGNYQALGELEIMSLAVNYNNWIWDTISPFIGENILEIGAGLGTFTDFLKTRSRIYATDIAENCIMALKERFEALSNIKMELFDITQQPVISLWTERKVDTAVCLNVLEHIKDDIGAFKNVNDILAAHGRIILMVPAFQFAYGTIDKLDGHFRRYSKGELSSKLKKTGFRLLKIHYFNSAGLLAWFYTNKVARDNATSVIKVKIYDKYFVPILRTGERMIKPPFGQSLIAIGEKQ
jgi:SAM-dependent methyltransferase